AGGEDERLGLHVDEARKGTGRYAGVDRADDQVAGEASLHGDGGGFRVADFAHQDDLRVLTHDAAQRDGVGEALRRIDLGLADHGEIELHRVFHGADADAGAVPLHDVTE